MMIQLLIFSGWVESDLIWHDLNPQEVDSRIVKNSGQSTTLSLIRRAYYGSIKRLKLCFL